MTNSYDGLGRLSAASVNLDGATRTLSYGYDIGSRRVRITHPDGNLFVWGPNFSGTLDHVLENGAGSGIGRLVDYDEDPFGRRTASTRGNGTTSSWSPDRIARNIYDSESRLIAEQRAYGTPLQQTYAAYTYSPNGRRLSVTDANRNRAELRYDGHDRQVRWVFPSPTSSGQVNELDYEEYGYDPAGNRTSHRRRDGSTLNFTYDNLNRLIVRVVPERAGLDPIHSRDVHYGYDAGNRQLYARFNSATDVGISFAYDGLGRLTSTTYAMGGVNGTIGYQYDAGGRRSIFLHARDPS